MKRALLPIAVYIALIVVANVATDNLGLVPIGLGLTVTAGTFAAGLVLIARDWLQLRASRIAVLLAIVVGTFVTAGTTTASLALASGIAFAASESVDWAIFTPLRERSLSLAVVVSSLVAAPIDTILFLWIAGFGVTWQAVLGQVIVKTGLALIAALALRRWRRDVPVRVEESASATAHA